MTGVGILTEDVLTALYEAHARPLHRYLARRLDPATADDLVAETFLQAWRQRARYNATRGTARAWLYGIATNLLRNHTRGEVRGLRALAREHARSVQGDPPDALAAARVDAANAANRLAGALAGLRTEERDVLMLIALADFTPAEAAEALGINVTTARTRLHRARHTLREALSDSLSLFSEEPPDA
ncbi:RNA polymerase sigma-70 factor, ECF subfamily [Amycolatopsis xylanica]|uniref:RNA polymerase sigma-70 factor, ECF subfamily n=2 Tax=Amycolatopsis xylanica TaxID=589385 RepID=A0A1H2YXK0_9PSEU|nr:RNA polymerase sigma-70 factor, ECF subfamily [Amycolatopsis xylanica]